ncbi:MAG: alpha/beta hydrolase [Bacteroidetes bacterium]|nr:alpha/beta hydrolase [Bacteroidota bacterium]
MEKVFTWRNSQINYVEFGEGTETLICFHGYGQDCTVFNVFEQSLGKKYRLVSVDLPFQGKTIWGEKEKLTPELLADLMTRFLLYVKASESISLLGYSIGGNYALGFAVAFKDKINDLWLIAADGLKRKPAFSFITKTSVGQLLFKSFVLYPGWFFSTVKFIKKLGLINPKALKFYKSTVDTLSKRQELFDRWSSTARISPGISKTIAEIGESDIRSFLIYGKSDSVISYKSAKRYQKLVPNTHLKLVDGGHRLLIPKTNEIINALLP